MAGMGGCSAVEMEMNLEDWIWGKQKGECLQSDIPVLLAGYFLTLSFPKLPSETR